MMRGLSAFTTSWPSPRRSIVPGAMFSTVMSAFFKSSLTSSSPRGDLRSSVSDFLFALNMWKYHGSSGALPGSTRRAGSPVFGFSILTTSAPSQASASVHEGPASNWVKSTTRTPARHSRSWQLSFMIDLLTMAAETSYPIAAGAIANARPPERSADDDGDQGVVPGPPAIGVSLRGASLGPKAGAWSVEAALGGRATIHHWVTDPTWA